MESGTCCLFLICISTLCLKVSFVLRGKILFRPSGFQISVQIFIGIHFWRAAGRIRAIRKTCASLHQISYHACAVNCRSTEFGNLCVPSADCASMHMTFHRDGVFRQSRLERRIDQFAYGSMSAFRQGLDIALGPLFSFFRLHKCVI